MFEIMKYLSNLQQNNSL